MKTRRWAALGVCLVVVGSAPAAVLISNLPGTDGTQTASIGGGRIKAMVFTMPAGLDYFLDDVTLRLRIGTTIPDPVISVYDDSGGLPGTSLATLVDPALTAGGIDSYAFTPSAPLTLEAGETYWVIAWSQTGTYDWMASSPSITPTGLATHAGSLFSASSGPNPPTTSSSILTSYAVNGTIVPEPASLTLLAVAGLALIRRR